MGPILPILATPDAERNGIFNFQYYDRHDAARQNMLQNGQSSIVDSAAPRHPRIYFDLAPDCYFSDQIPLVAI